MKKHDTYQELIKSLDTTNQKEYWKQITQNAPLLFWECQGSSKRKVAKDINISPQEFSLLYKVVYALASE